MEAGFKSTPVIGCVPFSVSLPLFYLHLLHLPDKQLVLGSFWSKSNADTPCIMDSFVVLASLHKTWDKWAHDSTYRAAVKVRGGIMP